MIIISCGADHRSKRSPSDHHTQRKNTWRHHPSEAGLVAQPARTTRVDQSSSSSSSSSRVAGGRHARPLRRARGRVVVVVVAFLPARDGVGNFELATPEVRVGEVEGGLEGGLVLELDMAKAAEFLRLGVRVVADGDDVAAFAGEMSLDVLARRGVVQIAAIYRQGTRDAFRRRPRRLPLVDADFEGSLGVGRTVKFEAGFEPGGIGEGDKRNAAEPLAVVEGFQLHRRHGTAAFAKVAADGLFGVAVRQAADVRRPRSLLLRRLRFLDLLLFPLLLLLLLRKRRRRRQSVGQSIARKKNGRRHGRRAGSVVGPAPKKRERRPRRRRRRPRRKR
mmetsp:Transcript_4509/g.11608  ORF Transcript_4509/g.11608 Transcript_4509/m.11608 type:complete len:334 (+) Transcript_4509:66-1067(+)